MFKENIHETQELLDRGDYLGLMKVLQNTIFSIDRLIPTASISISRRLLCNIYNCLYCLNRGSKKDKVYERFIEIWKEADYFCYSEKLKFKEDYFKDLTQFNERLIDIKKIERRGDMSLPSMLTEQIELIDSNFNTEHKYFFTIQKLVLESELAFYDYANDPSKIKPSVWGALQRYGIEDDLVDKYLNLKS